MGVSTKWRSGVASDAGKMRETNEDRCHVDDENGVFLVVDGVGGNAGGDIAASTAVELVPAELVRTGTSDIAECVRQAIVKANNRICEIAASDEALHGMGCVLTLAVLQDGLMTVGHVGDSRLYLMQNGSLRKITSDHSPVGEREDRGELNELEAMLHPRRHEVFRDVGSRPRTAGEQEFVELKQFQFEANAAVLLCSDGLTDMLTSGEIREIIEQYDGDPHRTAAALIECANHAGGHDNVTAVFVAGSEFGESFSDRMLQARARHSVTRQRRPPSLKHRLKLWLSARTAFLIYGFLLGILLAFTVLKLR